VKNRRLSATDRSGFTLLELLIALGMVAILAGSLYASLQVAFRAKKSAEASIVESRTVDLAMEFLRTAIQNAVPPNGVLAGNFVSDAGSDNRGDPATDLTFFSTVESPQHVDANGEIKQVELTIDTPDGNGGSGGKDFCLVQKITRNLLAPTTPNPDEEVICRGVSNFTCRYFDGQNWQDTWDSTQENNILPLAVEVTLQLENNPKQFVRVFPIGCSTITPGSTPDTSTGTN
jgi:prepilin-type N-terminal cleavage/methylation domain-containing protein